MTSNGSIRLVCFDLGGVIVRICRSWREAALAAGLELRGPWQTDAPTPPELQDLSIAFSTGFMDMQTWAARMSAGLGGVYSIDEVTAAHRAVLLGEYEGVADVIDRIHKAGLQTASLSNTDAQHWGMMQKYPALRKIQHRHASHLLQLHKPDPAIYRELQRRVKCQPHEILFLDDMPVNIESARTIGWHTELIDPFSRTDAQIVAAVNRYRMIS